MVKIRDDLISNYSARTSPISCIVLHHAVATSFSAVKSAFLNNGTSAHYCVGENEIVRYVDIKNTAWHARSANDFSIGIEHLNSSAGAPYPISGKVIENGGWLLAELAKQLGWTKLTIGQNVRYHSEFVSTACPGQIRDNGLGQQMVNNGNRLLQGTAAAVPVQPKPEIETEEMEMEFAFANRGAIYYVSGLNMTVLTNASEWAVLQATYNQVSQLTTGKSKNIPVRNWNNNDATANCWKKICKYSGKSTTEQFEEILGEIKRMQQEN